MRAVLIILGTAGITLALVGAFFGVRSFYHRSLRRYWDEKAKRIHLEKTLQQIESELVQITFPDDHLDQALRLIYRYEDPTDKKELA